MWSTSKDSGTFGNGSPCALSFSSSARNAMGSSCIRARSSLNALPFLSKKRRPAAWYSVERKSDQKFTIATPPFFASAFSMASSRFRR